MFVLLTNPNAQKHTHKEMKEVGEGSNKYISDALLKDLGNSCSVF